MLREVADAADLLRAAASAAALRAVFDSHLTKENDLVVPLLAARPASRCAELLGGMHELLGDAAEARQAQTRASAGCGGHTCACGEVDGPGYPELDVRSIPHAIRHATIFGALESVRPGPVWSWSRPTTRCRCWTRWTSAGPGPSRSTYSERGPEAWRLSLVRTDA